MNEIDQKRKERRQNLELVMFPASKNFPLEEGEDLKKSSLGTDLDDPLEELLNEFSEFEDELIDEAPEYDVLELEERNDELFEQLSCTSSQTSSTLLNEQMQLLQETQQRLKYYLDEIDSVLPTR